MRENTLDTTRTLPQLLRFVAPSIVMMLAMGIYTITDTLFVSRLVNTNALSAINIVCPMINLIIGLSSMLASGGVAELSRDMGAGLLEKVCKNAALLCVCTIGLGCVLAIGGLLFTDELLQLLHAKGRILPYARGYLSMLLLFTPFCMLQVLYQSMFVAAGRPLLGMVLAMCAGGVNVALDLAFMSGFHMGIEGSALATGIGYMVPAIYGTLFFLQRKERELHFARPAWDASMLKESCLNGSSEMVSQLASALTTLLLNTILFRLHQEDGVAAGTIIVYTQFLLTSLYIGFSMGAAPLISYQYGRKDTARLLQLLRKCIGIVVISSLAIFVTTILFQRPLVTLFTDKDTSVYRIALQGFAIFTFSLLFSGFNIFSSAMFTALSQGRLSALISFSRTFGFYLLFLLILPRWLGSRGVWLAIVLAEGCSLLVSLLSIQRHTLTCHLADRKKNRLY